MSSLTLNNSGSAVLKGLYTPPGDKSISHRAVMIASLADGKSRYSGFLDAEDCLRTLNAFEAMGIRAALDRTTKVLVIEGAGMTGLQAPKELYLGNSGTSMRLLLGILSGCRFETLLMGDPSLSSRPMKRVTQPLKKMGAQIKGADDANYAPLTIRGGRLQGIDFDNRLASAQVKSAILFAGLFAEGQTCVREGVPSRDHTERLLLAAGAPFRQEADRLIVEKAERLQALDGVIPGDISSAAFFIAGAAIRPGSELTVENVSLNPTRTGVLEVLRRMGADIRIEPTGDIPEPAGRIHVRGGRLKGTRVEKNEIPSLIDELPILMVAMALSEGESLISGAEELRVKETDRIHSMTTNLLRTGAQIEELPDGCVIRGVESLNGGSIQSFNDHRTVMSMAIASLAMRGELVIDETDSILTSFPGFFEDFAALRNASG